jgi:hypothetical protein
MLENVTGSKCGNSNLLCLHNSPEVKYESGTVQKANITSKYKTRTKIIQLASLTQ